MTRSDRHRKSLCELLERRRLLSGVTFGTPTPHGTGNSLGVVIVDLNGDGKPDIVAPESGLSGSSVDVYLGNGNGTFEEATNYSCAGAGLGASQPYAVAVADLTNNGKLDIVTANFGGTMSVLMGNGDGTFGLATVYAAESQPNGIAVGNFNGDGLPDIAVANRGDNTVGVYLNTGGGNFAAPVDYGVGTGPDSVGVGDFGNGHLDLFTANPTDNNISVLLGNGDGTFATAVDYSVPGGPIGAADADFNGDGKLDISTADSTSGNVSVILGNGDGTFGAAIASPALSTGAQSISARDFDGDGKADVAVVGLSTNSAAVLLGNGNGTFSAPTLLTPGLSGGDVACGDLNADGLPDLVFGSYGGGAQFATLLNTSPAPTPHLFVRTSSSGTIGEFTTTGTPINAALITGLTGSFPYGLAVSGSNLFISDFYAGTIGEYTTSGAVVNANLLTGLNAGGIGPFGIAISGSTMYVANGDGGSPGTSGTISAYTLGSTPGTITASNTALVTGLADPGFLAVSGSNIFIVDYANGVVGEYTTSGATVNAALVSGLDHPESIAISGSNLFVAQQGEADKISEYTMSGATVNANLITNLQGPLQIVVSGSNLIFNTNGGVVEQYTTAGILVNGSLIPSFPGAFALALSGSGGSSVTPPTPSPVKKIGALDPTFGNNGLASHDVGFASTAGVAIQPDGKSIIAGTVGASPTREFGLTRYNADGTLDTTFGSGGTVVESFNGTDDAPASVKILRDGEILVAGTATSFTGGGAAGSVFAVARFTSGGVLDAGFGAGGFALVGFSADGTATSELHAMAVAANGTIYLGGSSNSATSTETDFVLAALSSAGALVNAFGTGGKTLTDFAGGDDVVNSLALQTNGEVVAAGSATIGGVAQIALARYLPTGALDTHFGTKGLVTTKVRGVYDSASSVILTPKSQIIVGGLSASGSGSSLSSDFVVARFTSAGRIDRSFGNGPVITTFGQPSAVTQLVLQANGDLIASGKTTATLTALDPAQLEVALARFTIKGALDTSFNQTGKAIIDLSGASSSSLVSPSDEIRPLDASSLGDAFAALIASDQGVIAVTAGGELLAVGNSGSDTVEAAIVTAGVDLATKLIATLPAAALEGAKEQLSVTVTENGTGLASGNITIELYASPDGLLDTGLTPFQRISEKINLKQSRSHTFKLHYVLPSSAGVFHVVANVIDAALSELNANNNSIASTAAVNVAAPFVDLAASGLTYSPTPALGKSTTLSFTVVNNGNILARSAPVQILASPDGTVASGTVIATSKVSLSLAPGKTRKFRLSIHMPKTLPAGSYVLIAVLDPANTLHDPNAANNVIVGAGGFAVA